MIFFVGNYGVESTGANLCYNENSKILRDIGKAVSFKQAISLTSRLTKNDVLVTNSGPYGWVFHFLRDRYKKNFRIIRDCHTSLWSGYLLQESICCDYQKDNDKIFFPSEFCRSLYVKLFPHLNDDNSYVCFPVSSFFPEIDKSDLEDNQELSLAWLGSICYEKNFDQALDIFFSSLSEGLDVRFNVCGDIKQECFQSDLVKKKMVSLGLDPSRYTHVNAGVSVSHSDVWGHLKEADVILFPSTANLEANPRILSEATHAGTKILGSSHGGGYGVLPETNMIKTDYYDKTTDLINNQALGKVDVDSAVSMLNSFEKLKTAELNDFKGHDVRLKDLVLGEDIKHRYSINDKAQNFLKSLNLFINDVSFKEESLASAISVLNNYNHNDIGKMSLLLKKFFKYQTFAKIEGGVLKGH